MKDGFETVIDTKFQDKMWRLVRLPAKFGGMRLRSGVATHGAQYSVSVVKNSENIKRMLPDGEWDPAEVIKRDSKSWLEKTIGKEIDAAHLVSQLQEPLDEADPHDIDAWRRTSKPSR